MLLALFGIMLVARYGTGVLLGRLDVPLEGPAGPGVFIIGDTVFIAYQTVLVYAVTAAFFAAIILFPSRTWLGRSLRVASIDPLAASLMGVDLVRCAWSRSRSALPSPRSARGFISRSTRSVTSTELFRGSKGSSPYSSAAWHRRLARSWAASARVYRGGGLTIPALHLFRRGRLRAADGDIARPTEWVAGR